MRFIDARIFRSAITGSHCHYLITVGFMVGMFTMSGRGLKSCRCSFMLKERRKKKSLKIFLIANVLSAGELGDKLIKLKRLFRCLSFDISYKDRAFRDFVFLEKRQYEFVRIARKKKKKIRMRHQFDVVRTSSKRLLPRLFWNNSLERERRCWGNSVSLVLVSSDIFFFLQLIY